MTIENTINANALQASARMAIVVNLKTIKNSECEVVSNKSPFLVHSDSIT